MSQPSTHCRVNPTRNGNGSYRRDLEHVERDAEACRLASMGWPYFKIAVTLGYADKGAAWRGVQKVLVETARSHGTETLRQQQLTRARAVISFAAGPSSSANHGQRWPTMFAQVSREA